MRIEPVALIPFYALSAVSSPFFGQNIAAAKYDRLVEARRVISRFCLRFGLLLAAALCLIAEPLSALFTQSMAIREVAVDYIWLVSLSYGAYGLVMSVNAAFNGIGRPLPGVLISAMRVLIVFLPLAFLGHWLFGLPGLFGASALSNLGIGALAYRWLGSQICASRIAALANVGESFGFGSCGGPLVRDRVGGPRGTYARTERHRPCSPAVILRRCPKTRPFLPISKTSNPNTNQGEIISFSRLAAESAQGFSTTRAALRGGCRRLASYAGFGHSSLADVARPGECRARATHIAHRGSRGEPRRWAAERNRRRRCPSPARY